ncbi:cupin [Mycobacterium saskatchewanense]|uniref:Cupin type-2 domain-containing protein n=1 Tax=Mycobacterium saskatchewanense TaxID=220927 RepID=A0AAJ3NQA4_9MYCO|nr:cupin domain-containing protein [Mycobacterium saskatchewanense]ORW71464.1 hypothetical protein AWC23_14305 [Mycobacterium saskatchewanense]BBX63313.1 cupin [Mycobacterium saskatchewanense]
MQIRRVVTGNDDQGKAIFVDDAMVDPTTAALTTTTYHELWRADSLPQFPASGQNGAKTTFFPPPGGYRFFVLTVPPGDGHGELSGIDLQTCIEELEDKLPGLIAVSEVDDPGMHTTDTVDMEVVLAGEIVLELDDGAEKMLRAGDVNIQNGTRHRWHNRGDAPAVLAVAMIGGSRHR